MKQKNWFNLRLLLFVFVLLAKVCFFYRSTCMLLTPLSFEIFLFFSFVSKCLNLYYLLLVIVGTISFHRILSYTILFHS